MMNAVLTIQQLLIVVAWVKTNSFCSIMLEWINAYGAGLEVICWKSLVQKIATCCFATPRGAVWKKNHVYVAREVMIDLSTRQVRRQISSGRS
jgi:hypothetical protein